MGVGVGGWVDGWMDRWMDGSMDRWIDGSMDQCFIKVLIYHPVHIGLTVLLPCCVEMASPPKFLATLHTGLTTITLFHRDGKPPKFLEKPSIRQEGGRIIMSILLEAKPEPKVTWFQGATALSSGGRIMIRMEAGSAADSYRLILEVSVSRSRRLYYNLLKIIHDSSLTQ